MDKKLQYTNGMMIWFVILVLSIEGILFFVGRSGEKSPWFALHLFLALVAIVLFLFARFKYTGFENKVVHRWLVWTFSIDMLLVLVLGLWDLLHMP